MSLGRKFVSAVCVLALSGISAIHSATASTLLHDDFESYASGSNLVGQNGWTDEYGGVFTIQIDPGSGLSTQVVNGRHPYYGIHWASKSLAGSISSTDRVVLTFDGYGTSSFPPSTNSGVGLLAGPGLSNPTGGVWWDINSDAGGWSLDARGISGDTSNRFTIPGHYDAAGHFSIVLAGAVNEVYGIADFGSGPIETPHFVVTGSAIAALNKVVLFQDYQINVNRLGAEFDNLSITAVPEPAEVSLLLAGLALIYTRVQRRIRV